MTQPTEEEVERVARALCRFDGHPENIKFEGRPMWQSYIGQARAAIAAMQEEGKVKE